MLELSQDQKYALESLTDWWKSDDRAAYITLGGYAGTGKTTLISVFRDQLHKENQTLRVAFCSFTGKATRVLKSKLTEINAIFPKDSVSTIHALIYSPVTNSKDEIISWDRKKDIEADLIVIDEASMVDYDLWRDLTSYKKPIVAVGDHGQLPPINGNFNLMKEPQVRLSEIHRQAKDNPIIELSIMAREKGEIPFGKFGDGVKKMARNDSEAQEMVGEKMRYFTPDTLILCGYNNTRVRLNKYIRQNLEFEGEIPKPKDRVICLRNNHQKEIYNGMLGTIKEIAVENNEWYKAKIEMDDDGYIYNGSIFAAQFNNNQSLNFTKERGSSVKGDLFDFGYALTVHKAQGSQAKRVILFEERFKQMDDEMWRRWLYTAVTRASEELFILG